MNEYEKAVDALIPKAAKEARLKVVNLGIASEKRPGFDGRTYNHCFFTEFFHKAMNRLTIKAGLRQF